MKIHSKGCSMDSLWPESGVVEPSGAVEPLWRTVAGCLFLGLAVALTWVAL